MSRLLRVFLCHASQDKPAVWKLHRYLKQHGVQPWLDQEDLLPGQDWRVEIPKAIDTSDVILVCLSKNSVNKEGYVQAEITFALDKALEKPEGTIFIIPVKLEECEIPKRLGRYQWVDLSRSDGRKRLLMGLNKRAFDLGTEVSPVVLGDVRQQKTNQKPDESDTNEKSTRTVDRILATAKSVREQKEQEDREKGKLEIKNGEEHTLVEGVAPTQNEREKKQKLLDRTAEEARYLKDMLESIDGAKTKTGGSVVVVGPVEKEAYFPSEHKFTTQPTPSSIAGSQSRNRKLLMWVLSLIMLGLISLSIWGLYQLRAVFSAFTSTSSPTEQYVTETLTSTKLPTRATTTTSTVTPTELPFGIDSTMIGEDGMTLVFVPAGEFIMGSTDADSMAFSDEKPQHTVTLDAFWIDQTEVTNAMYAKCVLAGICLEPANKNSSTHSTYYGNPDFAKYPVIYVDWNMAKTYCEWAGRELPTEAQWEKAARGTDGRIYPWNGKIDAIHANYNQNIGDTTQVGYYGSVGKSFYGAFDMAGNVWEWVNDWYDENYYQVSPFSNSFGPNTGQYRILRGGSWVNADSYMRTAKRNKFIPLGTGDNIGFRCAGPP